MAISTMPRPKSPVSSPSLAGASAGPHASGSLTRRLRIVHLVSSLNMGGMEHFVLRIAEAQQTSGHQVIVIALQGGPLLETAKRNGLRACVLGGRHSIVRVVRGARILARFRPDVINVHNQTSLHYALLGKRIGNPRVVLINHGRGHGNARFASERDWQRTDAVVAVSQDVAAQLAELGLAHKTHVIHNGITPAPPTRTREAVRAELGLTDRCIGIMVARLDRLKGVDTLLHALALLRQSQTPITFLLVGDGPERADLEGLAQQVELGPEWVRFLGFRTDIPELLAASDLFALPSLTEGLPLSILEAMAQALPVVATCVGGIPELVTQNENGLLVPVKAPEALADAISLLVGSADLRQCMGEQGYRRVEQDFAFAQMTRKYDDLYARLRASNGNDSGPKRSAGPEEPAEPATSDGPELAGRPEVAKGPGRACP